MMNAVIKNILLIFNYLALFFALNSPLGFSQTTDPPNLPAQIQFVNGYLSVRYDGASILEAKIKSSKKDYEWHSAVDSIDGKVNQVIVFSARDWDKPVELEGDIEASGESFPCEVDRRPRIPDIVRNSFGLSHSLLNRAVYDRREDWVLSLDLNSTVAITPLKELADKNMFHITAKGFEVILRFRPLYYQRYRGLKYFKPWTYDVWRQPVVGWCSWFAYRQDINEEKITHVADVLSKSLLPFGYQYLQIDDGYQRGEGVPDHWLNSNEKFPSGLTHLSQAIASKGLKPGIWTNVAFNDSTYADQHPNWFVLDESGKPASGNWINYSLNGANPTALDSVISPVYRGFHGMGWQYFKVDALRHLRYEGYNSHPAYFAKQTIDQVEAYRTLVSRIRNEIGKNTYMLGCWGIRPELIGIIDGCRIGDDGFSYAGLSQYNSFNNVVWRNDPDHIELSQKEAYRSTMVTSLTGSVMMLTDKPETYVSDLIEPARRAAPTLFTRPGQIYDVDPSRSSLLDRVGFEVSGSGPRPFDAGYIAKADLYLLELNTSYDHWMVLGRTGVSVDRLNFSDIGLSSEKEYLVFEFWSKKLVGSYTGGMNFGAIDSKYNCQLFCIRERRTVPQLIATNRHISCGAFDVEDVQWHDGVLKGKSVLVPGDPYDLYVTVPNGFTFKRFEAVGADSTTSEIQGNLRICRIRFEQGGALSWKITFATTKF